MREQTSVAVGASGAAVMLPDTAGVPCSLVAVAVVLWKTNRVWRRHQFGWFPLREVFLQAGYGYLSP